MIRMQVQLTPEQHRGLKRWAAALGISVSEAVRRCVADRLERDVSPSGRADRVRDAMAIVGSYADKSGATQVAKDHDKYLAEAYDP